MKEILFKVAHEQISIEGDHTGAHGRAFDMEKDGACEMDRQNKKCSCSRKSGRIKNKTGIGKEEVKKLAGLVAKKELPAKG